MNAVIHRHRRGYTLTFDSDAHEYRLSTPQGEVRVLPSVTRVLSILGKPRVNAWAMDLMAQRIVEGYFPGMTPEELQGLLQEAKKAHQEEAKAAASTGSEVHDWIEAFLQGQVKAYPNTPQGERAVKAFLEWWEATPKTPLLTEAIVAHPPLGYAGKVDLVLGDGTLADFKTSKALYPEYHLQLGGYALALEWWEGIRPQKGLLIRIGKDGSLETQEVNLTETRETFTHLLEVYRFLQQDGTENR